MQCLALDVDVSAALFLDLAQDVVAGRAVDDEFLIGPALGAVNGKAASYTFNNLLQQ